MAGDKIVPCPEFQFSTTACYICNGYYGPCFEEPVCATCHTFLFPNDIGLFQVPIFSEKTDDEDSGNDEPTDLYYNHERRTSQQQQNSPQNVNSNISNSQNVPIHNANSFQNPESFRLDYGHNLEHMQQYQNCQDNCRAYEEVGESSRPYNLSERLEMLTNHKHIEHEPINEPGLVERLPPEVLLAVFSHLDDDMFSSNFSTNKSSKNGRILLEAK
ncbi:hypothetical protein KPH14_006168 [Odynerus spinipes]|uniref:F-box domain-containing protein n=1 Tax=Odynerus spinipes TaxID=1348599 RepID=A0AAD9RJK4_9HYME|nr:hypothetical protein KPH14_006168 [Odynerus spinipes]